MIVLHVGVLQVGVQLVWALRVPGSHAVWVEPVA